MVFLILVLLAVGAMSGLAVGLVGLVEAPWPVLLGLLLLSLYSLQRLGNVTPTMDANLPTPSAQAEATPSSPTEDDEDLSLTYRGVAYHPQQSSAPTSQTNDPNDLKLIEGMYRGQRWQRLVAKTQPPPSPPADET